MEAEKICTFTEPINDIELELWMIPTVDLKPSEYQRKYSKSLVAKIAASVAKGFFIPVLVILEDDIWKIIDGQHRKSAVMSVKGNALVPCIRLPQRFKDYALLYNIEKSDDIKDRCKKVYNMYTDFVGIYPERDESFIVEFIQEPHLLSLAFAHVEFSVNTLSLVETCVKKFESFLTLKMPSAQENRRHRGELIAQLVATVTEAADDAGVTDYFAKQGIVSKTNRALWEGKRRVDVPFDEGIGRTIEYIQETDWSFLSHFN